MRILVATDAWHPQVNGVVRTLTSLAKAVQTRRRDRFPHARRLSVLSAADLSRIAPRHHQAAARSRAASSSVGPTPFILRPKGPIGCLVRSYCLKRGLPFTTSYTTKFPEYISARVPIPESWSYAVLRDFHNASAVTMVATNSLMADLKQPGFTNIGMWTRGVDTELFRPDRAIDLKLPRPIFIAVGRVAIEKNLDAFLSLDLPGSKAVIGRGPEEERLKRQYPDATFFGPLG